jgi:hypothetical protein
MLGNRATATTCWLAHTKQQDCHGSRTMVASLIVGWNPNGYRYCMVVISAMIILWIVVADQTNHIHDDQLVHTGNQLWNGSYQVVVVQNPIDRVGSDCCAYVTTGHTSSNTRRTYICCRSVSSPIDNGIVPVKLLVPNCLPTNQPTNQPIPLQHLE